MADIIDPRHEALIEHLFKRTESLLGFSGFLLKPLRRRKRGIGKFHSYNQGYTELGSKSMTVDLYTPRTMKPRKTAAILRVIAHEFAHHQKPPKRMGGWFRGPARIVTHHPIFWGQYKKNVAKMKRDDVLGNHFPD